MLAGAKVRLGRVRKHLYDGPLQRDFITTFGKETCKELKSRLAKLTHGEKEPYYNGLQAGNIFREYIRPLGRVPFIVSVAFSSPADRGREKLRQGGAVLHQAAGPGEEHEKRDPKADQEEDHPERYAKKEDSADFAAAQPALHGRQGAK
jgi:hypothetical protein